MLNGSGKGPLRNFKASGEKSLRNLGEPGDQTRSQGNGERIREGT